MYAVIVGALGLTLGAAVCAIAFVDLMVARPLPYPSADRLVVAEQRIDDGGENTASRGFSYPAVTLLQDASRDVFELAVISDHARDVIASLPAQPLANVTYTTADYAAMFAPPMALGRFPGPADGWDGTRQVAVISHATWVTLFGKRDDVLGLPLRIASGMTFEIVGVTARDHIEPALRGPGHRTAVWLPWAFDPSRAQWGWAATTDTLTFVGRLAPGVTARQAAGRLADVIDAPWRAELAKQSTAHAGWSTRIEIESARRAIAGDGIAVGPLLVAGTVGLVFVTLANLAHLLIAAVAERTREFAIRTALGARRRHLFVDVFADVAMLLVPAGIVALGIAAAGFVAMRHFFATMLTRLDELSVGIGTGFGMVAASLVIALALATVACFANPRPAADGVLNDGRRATTALLSRRLRAVLMGSQVAIAGLLVMVGIGIFRDAARVLDEPGIALRDRVSAFLYPLPTASRPDAPAAPRYVDIKRRLAEQPGVVRVSQSHSPLQDFIPAAVTSLRTHASHGVGLKRIDDAYLDITGQSLARGRTFTGDEIQRGANVAMVNAALAARLAREGDVLGAQLSRGGDDPFTVVGVIDELAYPGVANDEPRVYLPAAEAGSNLIVQFRPGVRMDRAQFVAFLSAANPDVGVFLYDDLDAQRADILLPRRIAAIAALIALGVVLTVAAIGLIGMIRYTTRLIRTEIGTRRAFGARGRDILSMLARRHAVAVVAGCFVAAAVALLLLPAVGAAFDRFPLEVSVADIALALVALAALTLLVCHLALRPMLAQSPASALRGADR